MSALDFVDVYANLRRLGTVVLSVEERGRISGLRRRAAADGLAIVTHRERTKGLSKSQARNRATTVNLIHPDHPTLIHRPDWEK